MPTVVIVIIHYNAWDLLANCLACLNNQSWRHFDVVVCDNASTTPCPSGLSLDYANVRFVQNTVNTGFAAANNQMVNALAQVEWVVLLNPDAFPEPDWLENLLAAANTWPNYTVFASRQLMYNNRELLDGDGDVYHVSGLIWREGHGKPVQTAGRQPKEIFSACAAAAMYSRSAFVSVGGFDEDYFCYAEDVDLGFRLRLAGYKALLVPSALVCHVGSASTGGQQSHFSVYHGHRNLVWTYVKNMPGLLFWLLLPAHLLLTLVSLIVFGVRGQTKTIFQAKLDALSKLPKMWGKRRAIQQQRKVSSWEIWRMLNKNIFKC